MNTPRTLQQAIVYFSDPDRAFDYAVKLRWPDGKVICPHCSSDSNYHIRSKTKSGKPRRLWLCRSCNRQFTLKVNTIFEDSALSMDKWMMAFWMLVNCKNGVSSVEIHKAIGVTQKSAWFMLQRLRTALSNRSFGFTRKMGGPGTELEADETFIGGLTKNMHRDRKARVWEQGGLHGGKTAIQGIFDREARQVRAQVVPNVKRETLQGEVLKNVKYGTKVYTDSAVAYDSGLQGRFVHEFVNKTEAYVQGRVHTNGDLYLGEGDNSTVTFHDKVTAYGNVIRQVLANGKQLATNSYNGAVMIAGDSCTCCARSGVNRESP